MAYSSPSLITIAIAVCITTTNKVKTTSTARTLSAYMPIETLKPRIATIRTSLVRSQVSIEREIQQANKPSREPGYRITGRKGQTLRYQHLEKHPLCVYCLDRGITRVAEEVDHIIALANGGQDTSENRQSLCIPCHKKKTEADIGYKTNRPIWRIEESAEQRRKSDYIRSLMYPRNLRPSAIPLTIVCGPAGAGKSTYIAEHAQPGDTIIDMDQIRAKLGIGVNDWTSSTLKRSLIERNAMLAGLATAHLGSAWFIVSAASPQEREQWDRMLKPQRVVVVTASVHTCIARIRATRTGDRQGRSIRAARTWWSKYAPRPSEVQIQT